MVEQPYKQNVDRSPPPMADAWWDSVLQEVEKFYGGDEVYESEDVGEFHTVEDECESEYWEKAKELYHRDEVIQLKVTGYNRGGLLVEGSDLKGFVPVSHLVGSEERTEDDEIDVDEWLGSYLDTMIRLKVIECDSERGRVVFSERAAQADSGSRIRLLEDLEEGKIISGNVTTITAFGVFIDLGGIEGLVHISELSWGRVRHPGDILSVGEEVEAYVLQIDRERSRVALSIKRLMDNPWDSVMDRYQPGQVTEAVITCVVDFGAFARLDDGLDGLIHISEFGAVGNVEHPGEVLCEGQKVQVSILHVEPERQRLGLSLHSLVDIADLAG